MSTVRVETCPACGALVGEGFLYEHQQRHCNDACRRCGESMEAAGGKPTDGTRICRSCCMDDWLDEQGGHP